jgi:hypothetical protein
MKRLITLILKKYVRAAIARLTLYLLRPSIARTPGYFERWQQRGVHVLPVHYYSPVPDTRELSKTYPAPSGLIGIDMNEVGQLCFLDSIFPTFADEYNSFVVLDSPTEQQIEQSSSFVVSTDLFYGIDPFVSYCLIRHFKPAHIIEIGCGHSTRVACKALEQNGAGEIYCVEPYPSSMVKGIGGIKLISQKVQEIDCDFFNMLQANDILFIDSTHTVKLGGDVTYLMLEILPCLAPGVLVHIHDIFLPAPYPADWYVENHRFWAEQYLLQAYLVGNSQVDVVFANYYMSLKYPTLIQSVFPKAGEPVGLSFWMRTKRPEDTLESRIKGFARQEA